MAWFLLFFGVAVPSALLSYWAGRRAGRGRMLLAILLPFAILAAVFYAAFLIGERTATCNSPDCGPSLFLAIGSFAMFCAFSSFLGSLVGVVVGLDKARRSDKLPSERDQEAA